MEDLELPLESRIKDCTDTLYGSETRESPSVEGYSIVFEKLQLLIGKYVFSGLKSLRRYLMAITSEKSIPATLRHLALMAVLDYQQLEEDILRSDDAEEKCRKKECNKQVEKNNKDMKREAVGYLAEFCSHVCTHSTDLSTTTVLDLILQLMLENVYRSEASECYIHFLNNSTIGPEFRYKSIDTVFRERESEFAKQGLQTVAFAHDGGGDWSVRYKILACQFMLSQKDKLCLNENDVKCVEDLLLSLASNEEEEYNTRADAADVLLGLSSGEYQVQARRIIGELGKGELPMLYENKQNVHSETIEASVKDILKALMTVPTLRKDNGDEITVQEVIDNIRDKTPKSDLLSRGSLDRIEVDKSRYGGSLSLTLGIILVKLYSYISRSTPELQEELMQRLLEELQDMHGTCSSGYASRLANVLSGYDELFTLRISLEQQLIANFIARLSASARRIREPNSEFRTNEKLLLHVTELYLSGRPNIVEEMRSRLIVNDDMPGFKGVEQTEYVSKTRLSSMYLAENGVEEVLEEFEGKVLEELTVSTVEWEKRTNLSLFFRTNFSRIREELAKEFEHYVTETELDLYIRKAIAMFEGAVDWI